MDLDFMSGYEAVRQLAWARNRGDSTSRPIWTSEGDTWTARIIRWFIALGYTTVEDGKFVASDGRLLQLDTFDDKQAHHIREAWRRRKWDQWKKQTRRAVLEIGEKPYDELTCTRTRNVFAAASSDMHVKKVLAGAAVSHAAYSRMRKRPMPMVCPDCGVEDVPSWHHAVWECTHHAGTRLELTTPLCKLQARLGWLCTGDEAFDRKVLFHMGTVRANLLSVRYAD